MWRLFFSSLVLIPLLLPVSAVANQAHWPVQHPVRPLYSIDSADYQLNLDGAGAGGQITLRGQVLQGRPDPIVLFGHDLTVTAVSDIQGGTLLNTADGYRLFIGQTPAAFQLTLDVALPVQEDQRSRFVAFTVPAAVRNAVKLSLSDQLRVLESPGLQQADGWYYFPATGTLRIRFEDAAGAPTEVAPNIDVFSRIALAANQFRLTSYFVPVRKPAAPLVIHLPSGSYLNTSLKPSWLKADGDRLSVSLPHDWRQPFSIDYQVPLESETLTPAYIENNQGREGEFQLEEPTEARLTPDAEHLQSDIPASRLSSAMREFAGVSGSYQRLPAAAPLRIEVQRLATVNAPEIVLDAIHLYTSFSENGTALSVLRLELPAEAGRRLQLQPIAGAEIWSLTVNDQPRSLYSHESGSWVIPLDAGASVIELAYLQKGDKLGLKGRLDVHVPATGLATRRLNVAIALAERVELIAMEGDLEPTQDSDWPKVRGFTGTSYFFTHPFYRGDGLTAAIYYQEPLDNP